MTVLVTGSSGHLGEALVRTLKAGGQTVLGVDIEPSHYTSRVGSVCDRDFTRDCMQGVEVVYHSATLHKPHVVTHSKQEFIETNISGTLALLEAAVDASVKVFVFTSTTSLFGDALVPGNDSKAVWVTEQLQPFQKNIYGVTKAAAEDLCHLFHRRHGLDCIVLRTSRFFPEQDDSENLRAGFEDANIKANEMLFRRADVADIVQAHLLASEKAGSIGFGRYIISATTPFKQADRAALNANAPSVVGRYFPEFEEIYGSLGWRMFDRIGRVYVNYWACRDLGWRPHYDFAHVLACLEQGKDFRSELAQQIGSKGYHDKVFKNGPYPIE